MFELILATRNGDDQLHVDGADEVTRLPSGRVRAGWSRQPANLIRVSTPHGGFSVWPDEVNMGYPVLLPSLGVAVTTQDDHRDFEEISEEINKRAGQTELQRIASEPEDSYAAAAQRSRQLQGPTWLGLGRDLRTFGVSFHGVGAGRAEERMWDWVAPQWNGEGVVIDEAPDGPTRYQFMIGRGVGPQHQIQRRLAEGRMPILEASVTDGALTYDVTTFVTLERTPLTAQTNAGTHFLLADGHSAGHMFTAEQQHDFDRLAATYAPEEETAIFLRVIATNTADVPRHAFVTLPAPYVGLTHQPVPYNFDVSEGISAFSPERAFCTCTVNGQPALHEELSPLLAPAERKVFDIRIPHRPISIERARALRGRPYEAAEAECRQFWNDHLAAAAEVHLPEQRITDMVAAGLLHLDLVTYGNEPQGTLAPTIGIYAPIGSESSPIIQFYDSVGCADLARRSLQYFIDKQHDDGFMQNFGGYMLETEAALWTLGEHYRYTRDLNWVKEIEPALEAAVGHILNNRHTQQASGEQPHGLITGKTADPEDPFAAYMLNGFAYLGLSRAAEMINDIDAGKSASWNKEAVSLRGDIRASFAEAVASSPVVPLGDGTWSRTAPPWAGQQGPLTIDRSLERWFSHGSITVRDALLGPLWLVTQEVLDPGEPLTGELLDYHSELLFHDNTAFSQPYYSPHLLTHLRRGEVNAFLRAYYTMMASLADPETFSFWEHYFHASPHKTHEEAWFLMQTRWMLYLEKDEELRLLQGVPRAWLSRGEEIRVRNARSYFGPISFEIAVDGTGQRIDVDIRCEDLTRQPSLIKVRLPHPHHLQAGATTAGEYDAQSETVTITPEAGRSQFSLTFPPSE